MNADATATHHRRAGGREAKRAARLARGAVWVPYITRKIPYYEVLDEEGLALIERNADTILEEIGIEFRDDAEALQIWRAAGADVQGERVRFPRGMCRQLIQATAPREFIQHARNPEHNVHIGGKCTVFAPAYGSPFVRNLDMVYSHIRYSDKPFMGSVTAPERAADTVELAKIAFGERYMDAATGKPNTVIISLINANSPLTFDGTMLG